MPRRLGPSNLPAIELGVGFSSATCSVSGRNVCKLIIEVTTLTRRAISLNVKRPIIDRRQTQDEGIPNGLPLLSFYLNSYQGHLGGGPVLSYLLDVCYESDRRAQLAIPSVLTKADDYITLSAGYGYHQLVYKMNTAWSSIRAYSVQNRLFLNQEYVVLVGGHADQQPVEPRPWIRIPQFEAERLNVGLTRWSQNKIIFVE